ncbi:MAG: GNAT family N-acetyltransferase [Thermoguttaceae bacterium]|nr:GNAT family N-acetyltransferase [Thermoguttaceae bacterium]
MFNPIPLSETLTNFFASGWPPFIWHDPVMQQAWSKWFLFFPEFQCALAINGKLAATVHAVPLRWNAPFESLPDGMEMYESGWDWIIEQSLEDFYYERKPNVLSAAAIVVAPEMQGKGLAREAVKHLKNLARFYGFKALIAPLRPSQKRLFPDTDIEDYIAMKQPGTDLPFDPWIRLHVKLGARIIKPCLESVVISEPLEKWTQWTGVTFDKSGLYSIPGGDEPLVVDVEENQGDYSASGVWVVHDID